MVPVPVHQVLGHIGLGFVQGRVEVGRMLDGAGNRAHIEHLGVVGRQAEFPDSGRYIGHFHRLAQFAGLERRLVYLAAAEIPDGLPVGAPAAVGNAFSALGQLHLVRAVGLAEEEVAATAVFRDGSIADAIQDELAVRRKLRVAQPAQGKENFRRHLAVFDANVGRTDIGGFRLFVTAAHKQ